MEHNSGYWYGEGADDRRRRAIELLQAFRLYRAAEVAMRRRTRESMAMGENDLLTLRYLLKAQREDRVVSPAELARYLAVSTASVTAIIDRLEKSDHVRRGPHPSDQRRIMVTPTVDTDEEVRRTLGAMHSRMLEAVIDLSPEETRIVIDTLGRLQAAVDQVEPVPDDVPAP
ncbi:MarR family winged helix-turn-helix transcriptional regulator [Microbacterium gallinarum]|uniref:MarR family transcriptional regulator n=1 Tax=Microbacterium gallinarum TaxID=2762209 RepID=A0ABR8X625_9MICO|nr:MarR family transcriptional regulator [Microbacterium gallinarum]MBD8024775.1 MarR family transcriptional regulator [Microbacterium gallinarum]